MGAVLKIDILADGSKAGRTLDSVGKKVGGFAKAAGAGAAAGAVATGALAVASVKSASSVEQAFGAADSIFGKYAGQVKKAAAGAATEVGLAKSQYADLANVLGAQLKNMGTEADQLAPKTDNLIRLGADLAATFGGTTADAVAAVSSLLKGERDPIERYGVSIKAADVAAKMASMGLDGLTGAAAKQAEAQATLALLTDQTSAAQGAFGRESGTVAGQQQQLGAVWENLKATLGEGLLPVVSGFAAFMLEKVVPGAQKLAGEFRENVGPTLEKVGAFIRDQVVPRLKDLHGWFMEKIVPGLKKSVTPVLDGLKSAFVDVRDAIERNRPAIDKILGALKTFYEFAYTKVLPIVGSALGLAFKALGKIIGGVLDSVTMIIGAVEKAVTWFGRMKSAVGGGLQSAMEGAQRFVDRTAGRIDDLVDSVRNAIDWVGDLIAKVGRIPSGIGSGFGSIFSGGIFGFSSTAEPVAPATFSALSAPEPMALSAGLVGDGGGYTATASGPASSAFVAPTIVNKYEITVTGALDPVGTARQIRDLLRAEDRRSGRLAMAGGAY